VQTREVTWESPLKEVEEDVSVYAAQARQDNAVMLEHYLQTFGWTSRWVSRDMLARSVEGAKGSKAKEHAMVRALVQASAASLAREVSEVAASAKEASDKLQQARRAAELAKTHTGPLGPLDQERAKLLDFLSRCTTVHRDMERLASAETNRAKVEKRARERELAEMVRNSVRFSDRPRREVRSRLVEHEGNMILRENNYTMDEGITTLSASMGPRASKRRPPRTAYAFYARDEIKVVREADPDMDFSNVQRVVAHRWKEMPAEVRAPFHALAKVERDAYEAEKSAEAAAIREAVVEATRAREERQSGVTPKPAPSSSAASREGSDAEEEDEASEEDEDEDARSLTPGGGGGGGIATGTHTLAFTGNGGPPRPSLANIIDCALLAIGPRAGVSAAAVYEWAHTSPIGVRLCERIKAQTDLPAVQKQMRKFERIGRVSGGVGRAGRAWTDGRVGRRRLSTPRTRSRPRTRWPC
jgi:hypothetical protein